MDVKNSVHEAKLLIDFIERNGDEILCWDDAAPMIEALGGKPEVARDCNHSATLCIYIAALMVRNDRSTK